MLGFLRVGGGGGSHPTPVSSTLVWPKVTYDRSPYSETGGARVLPATPPHAVTATRGGGGALSITRARVCAARWRPPFSSLQSRSLDTTFKHRAAALLILLLCYPLPRSLYWFYMCSVLPRCPGGGGGGGYSNYFSVGRCLSGFWSRTDGDTTKNLFLLPMHIY